mgnify:CR=1 FL=1
MAKSTRSSSGYSFDSNSGGLVYATKTIDNTDSPYTVLAGDVVILCDCTAGAITVNMPALTSLGRVITVKKIDVSANFVTIDGDGAETIDGDATPDLTAQYQVKAMLDGSATDWSVI